MLQQPINVSEFFPIQQIKSPGLSRKTNIPYLQYKQYYIN